MIRKSKPTAIAYHTELNKDSARTLLWSRLGILSVTLFCYQLVCSFTKLALLAPNLTTVFYYQLALLSYQVTLLYNQVNLAFYQLRLPAYHLSLTK